jgi:hypothetical protein
MSTPASPFSRGKINGEVRMGAEAAEPVVEEPGGTDRE